MYRDAHTYDYSVDSKDLLFVGFGHDFDSNIRSFPYQSESYKYKIENNAFKAFRWLEDRVAQLDTYQLPYAIFCHLEWLISDDFRFTRQIAANQDLRFVPIIAFTEKGTVEYNHSLAECNVDDCYTVPVDWEKLEGRLVFLNQFKPRVLESTNQVKQETFHLGIPREKRVFDIIGASLGILFSIWIWLPVMIAIRLESKGPVVYKSKRVGFGYQVFEFLKFRSMFADSDQKLNSYKHLNQYGENESGESIFVKIQQDPRITRVGRFIRKYSIDELPQLLNVLRGDMSLVGNRPLPLYEAEMLTKDQWIARFLAPAGITGVWQVSKRGNADMSTEERIMMDVEFAKSQENYSVLDDIQITLQTFGAFVQKEDV